MSGRGGGSVYLPTLNSSPSMAYGVRKMVASYNGPLFKITRLNDVARMHVPAGSNGLPDCASISE